MTCCSYATESVTLACSEAYADAGSGQVTNGETLSGMSHLFISNLDKQSRNLTNWINSPTLYTLPPPPTNSFQLLIKSLLFKVQSPVLDSQLVPSCSPCSFDMVLSIVMNKFAQPGDLAGCPLCKLGLTVVLVASDAYFHSRYPVIEQRLAMSGVRLAAILNTIFG
jgi:hypothetical protein